MSQRFMSLKQLMASSSMRRGEMRAFVRMLAAQKMLHQRLRPTSAAAAVVRLSRCLAGAVLGPFRRFGAR